MGCEKQPQNKPKNIGVNIVTEQAKEQTVSNPVEAVVNCDFDHCKNEAVGMVNDTKEVLSDNGCRNFKIHSKHFYCNQHMRESINYGRSN